MHYPVNWRCIDWRSRVYADPLPFRLTMRYARLKLIGWRVLLVAGLVAGLALGFYHEGRLF